MNKYFFCTNLFHISQMAATTRNVFIANLAMADLLLCLFTIPLTLIDLVNKYWGLAPGMVRPSKIQESKLMHDKTKPSSKSLENTCSGICVQAYGDNTVFLRLLLLLFNRPHRSR